MEQTLKFNNLIGSLQKVHPFNLWQGDRKIFDATLQGISASSAEIKPGYVFAALKGTRVNGARFIPDAIDRGAVAIIACPESYHQYSDQFPTVTFIETNNPKLCFALMASLFYPKAPEQIVAVTGTNGKSSTVDFVRQIWEKMGIRAASIGTLGTISKHYKAPKHLTTPDPVFLHQTMQELNKNNITHVAIEASSHGIDQFRLDGLKLSAGGFTSFGHDHLDYHKTLDKYFEAKANLFSRLLKKTLGIAVLNSDIPEFKSLTEASRGLPIISYGHKGKELKINQITPHAKGQSISLSVFEDTYKIDFPLLGDFQIQNALCALGLVLNDIDADIGKAVHALETLQSPPGRLEYIAQTKRGATVYVDYAHAAHAIEMVLKTLRAHTQNQLWIVFGAGGGRDPSTRLEMGKAAAQGADHVIVTDDNPRYEEPALIREAILRGAPKALDIPDRHDAIKYALQHAASGDIILVSGKGPEGGQIYADHIEPFLDKDVILKALKQKVAHEK